MITGRQIRAARSLLDWTAADLAEKAGLTRETVSRIEVDTVQAREGSLEKILRALDGHGIEFTANQGVRFRPDGIEVLIGRQGLISLMEDIYDACRKGIAGDLVLAGAPEDNFERILGDYDATYLANMSSIPNLKMRTIIKEGDTNVVSSAYTEYRWASKEQFQAVPFYAYADKLAIVVFESDPSPRIVIIQSKSIADAYRRQFENMWLLASPIPPSLGNRDGH